MKGHGFAVLCGMTAAFGLGVEAGAAWVHSHTRPHPSDGWSRWGVTEFVQPRRPWADWMYVQSRTNTQTGEAQMRVVLKGE